jgi:hypothetical protein
LINRTGKQIAKGIKMSPQHSKEQDLEEKHNPKRKLCPFVRTPQSECYFLDMNSNKISMAVYYCQNHFRQCEIYKRKKKPEDHKERIGRDEMQAD